MFVHLHLESMSNILAPTLIPGNIDFETISEIYFQNGIELHDPTRSYSV